MGYFTYFWLRLENAWEQETEIIGDLRATYEDADDGIDEEGDAIQKVAWSSHVEDLLAFSKKYPQVLFRLEGEGEEHGDYWKHYFKNGKQQVARGVMTYPAYDEAKLT